MKKKKFQYRNSTWTIHQYISDIEIAPGLRNCLHFGYNKMWENNISKYVPILAAVLNISFFRNISFSFVKPYDPPLSLHNNYSCKWVWVIMRNQTVAITQRLCTVTFYLHTEKNASILVLNPSLEQNWIYIFL